MTTIEFNDSLTSTDSMEFDDTEVLITNEVITIKFSYPLDRNVWFKYHRPEFTKRAIFLCILKGYRNIYNRPRYYGIWGHGIDDLFLEGCEYNKGNLELTMGS